MRALLSVSLRPTSNQPSLFNYSAPRIQRPSLKPENWRCKKRGWFKTLIAVSCQTPERWDAQKSACRRRSGCLSDT